MKETFWVSCGLAAGIVSGAGAVFVLSPLGWAGGVIIGVMLLPLLVKLLAPAQAQPPRIEQGWRVIDSPAVIAERKRLAEQ